MVMKEGMKLSKLLNNANLCFLKDKIRTMLCTCPIKSKERRNFLCETEISLIFNGNK